MKLNRIRNYRRKLRMTSGVLKDNPVLALGLALPFVIIPSQSLKSGVAMSLVLLVATVPCAVLSSLVGKQLQLWAKAPLCVLLSMGCILLTLPLLRHWPMVVDALGMYIPLASVNTIMLSLSVFRPRRRPGRALCDSLKMCLGFALVVCGVSALREILGSRTLWDQAFGMYPLRMYGATLPFFGFILLGFLGALFRSIDRATVRAMLGRGAAAHAREAAGHE